jgi:hypothetical protein
VYKLYAESFKGSEHLRAIQAQAQAAIQGVFDKTTSSPPRTEAARPRRSA